jgi:UDP-N-acetylglucosamine 4,6-dehydratase/5-epimerase|tara:strand:- start:2403 stop:3416 length:1014 start_codon:yes stop_codon:yes gene_type:complete
MFKGKKILITGGTGSLGQSLTKRLLETDADTIRIFSRNESKQVEMESKFDDGRLRFLIGDIRDNQRLVTAFEDIDIVFHAAALKHVPVIEYNPFEAIKTNVYGSQNVIDASLSQDVEKVICIGTDKAVSPLNTYGATKLLMEKLFVSANNSLNEKRHKTSFLALRYGNVVGSSGSVIPKFIKMINEGKKITITDSEMTRFSITMEQALDFIIDCTQNGKPSEIYVPKLKSYSIMDVKDALFDLLGKTDFNVVGIRPGEKLHETLINSEEIRNSWDLQNKFMISNPIRNDDEIIQSYDNQIKKITDIDEYSSKIVTHHSKNELIEIIKKSNLLNHKDD